MKLDMLFSTVKGDIKNVIKRRGHCACFHAIMLINMVNDLSSPVPLPDLYFDSFSCPVAPIISSAGGIL